jgi:hypothetical protein
MDFTPRSRQPGRVPTQLEPFQATRPFAADLAAHDGVPRYELATRPTNSV